MSAKASKGFTQLNRGYDQIFNDGKLSLGLVVPIEAYPNSPIPTMEQHIERVQLAEQLGFTAVWLRDVPFNVPSFGDAGQTFDPFVYLGLLAGKTVKITLGVASVILPFRHPAQTAKAAASVDTLSNGRLVLGVATGDRPDEYPAHGLPFDTRDELFRSNFDYIRAMAEEHTHFNNDYGEVAAALEMLPKPTASKLPLLVTGSSRQNPDWIAEHSDGWITYPRPLNQQAHAISDWRQRAIKICGYSKPVMEPLYIDLVDDPKAPPTPIHLGLCTGLDGLYDYLKHREGIGVNHIALNLRFNRADINQTLTVLAENILPDFT